MTTYSKADLRERVAEHLTVKASDLPLDADDATRIDRAIDDVWALESEAGLFWWPEDEIPASVILPVTLMISAIACAKVGKAGQGYEDGYATGTAGLSKIKPPMDVDPLEIEFF